VELLTPNDEVFFLEREASPHSVYLYTDGDASLVWEDLKLIGE
jgi:hypothetical protein